MFENGVLLKGRCKSNIAELKQNFSFRIFFLLQTCLPILLPTPLEVHNVQVQHKMTSFPYEKMKQGRKGLNKIGYVFTTFLPPLYTESDCCTTTHPTSITSSIANSRVQAVCSTNVLWKHFHCLLLYLQHVSVMCCEFPKCCT